MQAFSSNGGHGGLPDPVSLPVCLLFAQIAGLDAKIGRVEKQPSAEARQDEVARRFMTVLATGPTAMAFQASHHGWKASSAGVTPPPGSAWLRASTRPEAGRMVARKPTTLAAVALPTRYPASRGR